jgi:hypothetical protein
MLTPAQRAVAAVAETLYDSHRHHWWQRKITRFDFVPVACLVVGRLISDGHIAARREET